MVSKIQMVNNSSGISVCITKGYYNDEVTLDMECSSFEIEGQTSGRDDWILEMALELRKPIHVFYRTKVSKPFSYMGVVDHTSSIVIQERVDKDNLLQAILFTDKGSSTMEDVGVTSDPSYKYKSAVFEHIGVDRESIFPGSLLGCFHMVK